VRQLLVTADILPPNRLFLQELHDVTSRKKAFFIVTAVKASNLKRQVKYMIKIYWARNNLSEQTSSDALPVVIEERYSGILLSAHP
jgi:hypothetical protein